LTPALANTLPKCFVSPRNSTAAGVAAVMSVVVSGFGRESQRSALRRCWLVARLASRWSDDVPKLARGPAGAGSDSSGSSGAVSLAQVGAQPGSLVVIGRRLRGAPVYSSILPLFFLYSFSSLRAFPRPYRPPPPGRDPAYSRWAQGSRPAHFAA
jgi:hypothetical protein